MREECNYCDRLLDPDEELFPVYIGKPSVPPITSEALVESPDPSITGFQKIRGRTPGEIIATLQAIKGCRDIQLTTSPRVREVSHHSGADLTDVSGVDINAGSMELMEDRCLAEIEITPDVDVGEPDLKVCKYCRESLSEGKPLI